MSHSGPARESRRPQLQTVQFEGAGHNVRRDPFELYWRAVRGFLVADILTAADD